MSAKVIILDCATSLPIPCDRVLEAAKGKLEKCVVVGFDKDGEIYFAASEGSVTDAFYTLERVKHKLLDFDTDF